MSTIWVFPGQGAQHPNMLHDLPQHHLVQHYIQQASDVLDQDVLLLDQPDALKSTYAVQICLYIAGVVSAALLQEHAGQPQFVAGLSIGAWAAATTAKVITFEDGLKLVAKRGQLMQEAYPSGYGMTAILGADQARVEMWVNAVKSTHAEVYIANINTETQIVISGEINAMQAVGSLAQQNGAVCKKVEISVPSHCELLTQQAQQLAKMMEGIRTQQPSIKYLSGTSARVLPADRQIVDDIVFNMCRMIRWDNTVRAAWERGARLHIEVLPGNVLTGLAKKTFKEGTVLSFQNTQLESLMTAMHIQQGCI
ncbi:malonate decarboxylase subunit epsilon [uncultured Acinetobacter sp.]|uniref:malonate decarboxylase subunit epsilon n=1 Tax=uncultured Acinetobacter sp. TaxID=165433 RepID=UPI0025832B6D|nr:malonate decarboxylase subunit epsilon [uncultured Acinetobacter sp.]